MTKKDKNNFSEYVAEKQKLEKRLESIREELSSSQIDPGLISKMGRETGDAGMRFENFKARYAKGGTVPENYHSECGRLESVFEAARERSLAAKAKRNSLGAEEVE